jgi:hypothetical protein
MFYPFHRREDSTNGVLEFIHGSSRGFARQRPLNGGTRRSLSGRDP